MNQSNIVKNPKYGDFVNIEENGIPFYQYQQEHLGLKNLSKVDNLQNKNSIFEVNHRISMPTTKMTPEELEHFKSSYKPAPVRESKVENNISKNSIFDMDHRITKPTTKMTPEELEKFLAGANANPVIAQQNKEQLAPVIAQPKEVDSPTYSMFVPLYHPKRPISPKAPPTHEKEIVPYLKLYSEKDLRKLMDESLRDREILVRFLPIAKNLLGYGQYSKVYRGTFSVASSDIEYPCAVKKMNKGSESQKLAMIEINLLSRINSTFVISLIDVLDEGGVDRDQINNLADCVFTPNLKIPDSLQLQLVLEYCSNGNMWNWMMNHGNIISSKLWLKWATQLAAGINEIHSHGIIHHDIKPHNILLTELLDIRICDFGNAFLVPEKVENLHAESPTIIPGSPTKKRSQDLIDGLGRGTLAYSAAELLSSANSYSFPVDIYSLGVLLYTIISQQPPFPSKSTVQTMIAIKNGFFQNENQALIMKWKNPDPADGDWMFPCGTSVDPILVKLVFEMVSLDPQSRPTATEIIQRLHTFEVEH